MLGAAEVRRSAASSARMLQAAEVRLPHRRIVSAPAQRRRDQSWLSPGNREGPDRSGLPLDPRRRAAGEIAHDIIQLGIEQGTHTRLEVVAPGLVFGALDDDEAAVRILERAAASVDGHSGPDLTCSEWMRTTPSAELEIAPDFNIAPSASRWMVAHS